MKRKFTLIATIILIAKSSLTAQWTQLNPPTNLNLAVINQTPAGSLLVASRGAPPTLATGIILKSDDNGTNWYNVVTNDRGFSDIVFPSANRALAIPKSHDTIFVSTDGGNSWQQQYSMNCFGGGYGFADVFFTDSITGYAPGFKTYDGGDSWIPQHQQQLNLFPYIATGLTFLNDTTGIIVGYEYWAVIYKTTDSGATWSPTIIPPGTWEIYSVHFPTALTGYSTGHKYGSPHESIIMKTTDGGDHWSTVYNTSISSVFLSVFCPDSNTCYAVGVNGNIVKTTDGGATWAPQYSGTTHTLTKVFFTDINTGYIVGDSGTVLKTINGGGPVGTSETTSRNPTLELYPNPVQEQLTIKNNSNGDCDFIIYNLHGEKIFEKILASKMTTLDLSSYSAGVYFYKIYYQNSFTMGKIVKL